MDMGYLQNNWSSVHRVPWDWKWRKNSWPKESEKMCRRETLAINLELCTDSAVWNLRWEGWLSSLKGWRAKEKNSPLDSAHSLACSSRKLLGMRALAFETLMMSATKVEKRTRVKFKLRADSFQFWKPHLGPSCVPGTVPGAIGIQRWIRPT